MSAERKASALVYSSRRLTDRCLLSFNRGIPTLPHTAKQWLPEALPKKRRRTEVAVPLNLQR